MKLLLAAVVLVVCVSVAVSQQEYKCTTPYVWYSHFLEFNPSRREENRGSFYYDRDNERVAVRDERREGSFNNVTMYHEIYLHKEGVGYSINNATKDCRRFKLNEPFPVIGPYLDDKYQGEAYIGSADQPKDGVRVQMYSGSNERGEFFGVWVPVDSEEGNDCIPVSEIFTRASDRTTSRRSYYDVRLGIFDTSVFTPPSNCF